jgi:hypothetical protein
MDANGGAKSSGGTSGNKINGVDLPPENKATCDATSTLHDAWELAVHRAFSGILPELLGDRPKDGPSFASPDVRTGPSVRLRNFRWPFAWLDAETYSGSLWAPKATQST